MGVHVCVLLFTVGLVGIMPWHGWGTRVLYAVRPVPVWP